MAYATVTQLNAEIANRKSADAAEAKARADGDGTEAGVRSAADAALAARLDAVEAALAALANPQPPPVIVGGATPNIPSSIDPTGQVDVTSAIQSWLMGLPAGATAVMGNSAIYRTDGTIHLSAVKPLTIDGNGSTTRLTFRSNTRIWLVDGGGGPFALKNLTILGANPDPGLWVYAYEQNHGLQFGGVQGIDIGNVTIKNVGGDFVYLSGGANQWSKDAHVHQCHLSGCGRMGIAITDGLSGGLIEDNDIDHVGYYTFDIEPNGATVAGRLAGAEHVKFLNNRIGLIPYGRNPVVTGQATGYAFCTTNASAKGTTPIIDDVEVAYNVIADPDWPDFRVGLFAPQGTAINVHDNVR